MKDWQSLFDAGDAEGLVRLGTDLFRSGDETSSENWRLNLAATVQPSRLLPLAAFSISAVATIGACV
ncbi:MAG: hypothetical protein II337_07220, partial [Clostridia bacterium]|nr:hypothetical protein [Clostridia bacterium]